MCFLWLKHEVGISVLLLRKFCGKKIPPLSWVFYSLMLPHNVSEDVKKQINIIMFFCKLFVKSKGGSKLLRQWLFFMLTYLCNQLDTKNRTWHFVSHSAQKHACLVLISKASDQMSFLLLLSCLRETNLIGSKASYKLPIYSQNANQRCI